MRMRIVAAEAKVGYYLISGLVAILVVALSWATLGPLAGVLSAIPLQLIVVGFAVRNFRDAEIEAVDEPRPWWRMTARPPSGFAFGALFVAEGVWSSIGGFHYPNAWAFVLGGATSVVIGAVFIRSSLKLRTGIDGIVAGRG